MLWRLNLFRFLFQLIRLNDDLIFLSFVTSDTRWSFTLAVMAVDAAILDAFEALVNFQLLWFLPYCSYIRHPNDYTALNLLTRSIILLIVFDYVFDYIDVWWRWVPLNNFPFNAFDFSGWSLYYQRSYVFLFLLACLLFFSKFAILLPLNKRLWQFTSCVDLRIFKWRSTVLFVLVLYISSSISVRFNFILIVLWCDFRAWGLIWAALFLYLLMVVLNFVWIFN